MPLLDKKVQDHEQNIRPQRGQQKKQSKYNASNSTRMNKKGDGWYPSLIPIPQYVLKKKTEHSYQKCSP